MAVAGAPSAPSSYVGGRTGVMFAGVLGMIALIMASTMINVAVPHIMGAYGLGQDQAHWMSSGFLAAMTVSMLANAALVTRFGARTVFLGAILIFTAASIAGLLAPNYLTVVLARALQGFCAGIIQPLVMGTLFLVFEPHERGKAMGLVGMGIVMGPAIGPILGGMIVDGIGWRYSFVGAVPFALLAAVAGLFFMPLKDPNAHRAPFNLLSFCLVTAATLLFLNGITASQREGWWDDRSFAMLFGAALAAVAFVIIELRSRHPLIQMRLFTYRMYVMATIVGAMFGAGMFGSIYLAPILAQLVHSYSATDAGIMLLPGGIVAMLTFPIAGQLSQRVSPSILMPVGLILFAISNWWLASSSMETAFWTLAWMIAFGRIGLGIVMPALNYSALSAVPPELVPYASGTLNFVRMTGAAIGVNALAITLDVRFGGAIKSLAAMQTSANEATRAAMLDLSALFASGGLPASASNTAAMSYLRDLLSLKALEASFQTAFLVLALGFVVAAIAAAILMREPRSKSH